MKKEKRLNDIVKCDVFFPINVNGVNIPAVKDESVLSALLASGIRVLMLNDYGEKSGAYCGMGVCHCCIINIENKYKQKACQTIVKPGMSIFTELNRVLSGELKNER